MRSTRPANPTPVSSLSPLVSILLMLSLMVSAFGVVVPVEAARGSHQHQDALFLMSFSQTLLAGEFEEEVEYAKMPEAVMLVGRPLTSAVDEQLLIASINAVKYQISTLIEECNTTRRVLLERNEECAIRTLDGLCEQGKGELRATLSLLRQIRGDKRKFFTRVGHSLKTAGKRIWHAIGPLGRRILSSLGEEVVRAVTSPGGVEFAALRVLVRSRLKSIARRELRNTLQRGIERQIMKKWEVARGPGGDQCIEADQPSVDSSGAGKDCTGDISWIEEGWPEVEIAMRAERKYCMDRGEYRLCLRDKTLEGLCPEDALEACQPLYDAIPPQGVGEMIEVVDQEAFYRDHDNYLDLSFPLDGGKVEGYMEIDFDDSPFDGWYCFVTMTFNFSGIYDPGTCVLKGAGIYTLDYVEDREGDCLGYSGPKEETRDWAMRIRNGRLETCGEAPGSLMCETYDLLVTE